ncbi:hypothetical protein GCM10009720_06880 [Yaniella flava]|uniref:Uncharacterized protein n=1 Tax=Yaniella flava TaxID=287930 RepID=A0ABP5FM74_9MICC
MILPVDVPSIRNSWIVFGARLKATDIGDPVYLDNRMVSAPIA